MSISIGKVSAIAGGTPDHADIAANLIREIGNSLRVTGCRIRSSNLGIKLPSGLYTYADATISCGNQFEGNFLLNPLVIFEILSDSTEAYDRGKKFEQYREIRSLQEYVLIAPDRLYVEVHTRGEGEWIMRELKNLNDVLSVSSAAVSLQAIYTSSRQIGSDPL